MMQKGGLLIEGRGDVERRTLYKGAMMQKEDIITKRDDAEAREL